MEAILKFFLVLIILYYGARLFIRYVIPWLLARFVRKQQEKYNNMSGFDNSKQNFAGNDHNNFRSEKRKDRNDDNGFGEYVDFEEIKE